MPKRDQRTNESVTKEEVPCRWTIIGPGSTIKLVLCRCQCGTEKEVNKGNLKQGLTKSCGCWNQERRTKHGKCGTPEYAAWSRMIQRCTNPNGFRSKDYYGRGIKVCERWTSSFDTFLEDMGLRPSDDHSLDRINNDGNYEPGNCRWATRGEQQRNKRTTKLYELNGVSKCPTEWAEQYGVDAGMVMYRLDRGWDLEIALTVPALKPRGRSASSHKEDTAEFNGRTQTLLEWSQEFGLDWKMFYTRYTAGWSLLRIKGQLAGTRLRK